MNDSTGKRVTDDERRRASDLLSRALGQGQLSLTEFDDRSALAFKAVYRGDLVTLLDDLLDHPERELFGATPGMPYQNVPAPFQQAQPPSLNEKVANAVEMAKHQVTGEPGTSSLSIAIMGGATRRHWVAPKHHTSIAVMGGNEIDLRDARFEAHEITVMVFAVMGGVEIIVPEGVRVINDGFALMGGFDSSMDKRAEISPASLPSDAPTVRITGFALMGGVNVVTRPRGV